MNLSQGGAETPAELSAFPVVISLPVLWGDEDTFQHVNNTVFIRWIESSRMAYMDEITGTQRRTETGLGPILAAVHCNYRRQVHFPDTVFIGARVSQIGNSSLVLDHAIFSRQQSAIVADGQSTIVIFDYRQGRSHQIPDSMREAISRLEDQRPNS